MPLHPSCLSLTFDSTTDSSLVESRVLEIEYASDDDIFNGDIGVVDETIKLINDDGEMVRMGDTVYICSRISTSFSVKSHPVISGSSGLLDLLKQE